MIFARNPIDVIAESLLCASEDTFEVSEDIIADLNDAGWHLVWAPENDIEEIVHRAA